TTGTTVPLSWSVRNVGTAAAPGAWVDRVFLSTDAALDAGDRLLGEAPHTGPLDPGGSYTAQLDVPIPDAAARARFLLLQTDATFQVTELAGEANNLAASAVRVELAPFADLAVSGVSVTPSPAVGDPARVTVGWTVTNVGTGPGAASWTDAVIASANDV